MILRLVLCLSALMLATSVQAQDREVPYWASLRADEINMRVGPSADYKIEWVYRRRGLPVKVVRVMEGWRLIEDPDGARGWVASRLLDPDRGAMVIGKNPATMHEEGEEASGIKWRLEPGVVGRLSDCDDGWCEFTVGKRAGWVRQESLWGAGEP